MSATIPAKAMRTTGSMPDPLGASGAGKARSGAGQRSVASSGSSASADSGPDAYERASAQTRRTREAVVEAIAQELDSARDAGDRSGLRISTDVHEETGRYIVRIVEEDTGEVVREYPQEGYLEVIAIMEQVEGLLLEETI